MAAGELATLLFVWPPYAAFTTATGTDRVRRRVRDRLVLLRR